MYWVKLTRAHDGHDLYVNLERFDRIEALVDEDGKSVTLISATLSSTEEDAVEIEVVESPGSFLPLMEVE